MINRFKRTPIYTISVGPRISQCHIKNRLPINLMANPANQSGPARRFTNLYTVYYKTTVLTPKHYNIERMIDPLHLLNTEALHFFLPVDAHEFSRFD